MVRFMLERHDANSDGKLTGDEIPERMRENLERVDTNNDQAVDKAELEQMARRIAEQRGPRGEGGPRVPREGVPREGGPREGGPRHGRGGREGDRPRPEGDKE